MGSSVPAFEATVEIGVSDRDGSSLPIGFDANGTNLLSSPGSKYLQGIPSRLVE
jgi:hypothetical protein